MSDADLIWASIATLGARLRAGEIFDRVPPMRADPARRNADR